ncbi:hypothetical protein HRbin40_01388 [bacterium HR40]|nr:hypothetical protein HRbin40_01388 [bacterium HR40]
MTTTKTQTAIPTFPKFDPEALVALHRANLETWFQAQKILFDYVQTLTRRQAELVNELFARAESFLKGADAKKQPQAYVEEAKQAIEKAMAEAKEAVDLGLKAQAEVVDLFVKRAAANLDEVKKFAA